MKELAQYRFAEALSFLLPRRVSYALSDYIADRCWRRDEVGRSAVIANLRRVFEYRGTPLSDAQLQSEARQTFRHFGRYLVEFFTYERPLTPRQSARLMRWENRHFLDETLRQERGALLITAHLGNWELGGALLAGEGYRLNALALPQKDPRIDKFFFERRQRRGMRIIPVGHAAGEVISAFKRKEIVALLGDRDYTARNDKALFFGVEARMPRGPAWLAERLKVPLLPAFVLREKDNCFRLRFHKPLLAEDGLDAPAIQQRLCLILEEEIGRNPHQWYMFRPVWEGRSYGGELLRRPGDAAPGPWV